MASFPALSSILGASGVPLPVKSAVESHKEVLEILTGQRGEGGGRAILKDHISVKSSPDIRLRRTAALPTGLSIDGVLVAPAAQLAQLIADMDVVIADLKAQRDVVNALIAQLRA